MAETLYDLIIIGAGASGLMAAQAAAISCRVLVLEGTSVAGAKLLMSGGGRCNATNAVVSEKDFSSGSPRIVRHVLKHLSPAEVIQFFGRHGVKFKLEEDGKYFTASDRAGAVRDALLTAARSSGVRIEHRRRVLGVGFSDGRFEIAGAGFQYYAPLLLVATGGLSYPSTGCDGFGYAVARQFGHTLIPAVPALTPLMTDHADWTRLQGISMRCNLMLWADGKKLITREGSLLFTHFGFSGPAALDISRYWAASGGSQNKKVTVDFFPLSKEYDMAEKYSGTKKSVRAVLGEVLPARLVEVVTGIAGIDGSKVFAGLSGAEKRKLQGQCHNCELPVTGVMGWGKAEATAGGVDLRELKGATLESKRQPGLFFCGEVLDVDGRVGGFNLHWAWASGVAAARGVIKNIKGEL